MCKEDACDTRSIDHHKNNIPGQSTLYGSYRNRLPLVEVRVVRLAVADAVDELVEAVVRHGGDLSGDAKEGDHDTSEG